MKTLCEIDDILQYMQFFTELHNWMASKIKTVKLFLLQDIFHIFVTSLQQFYSDKTFKY